MCHFVLVLECFCEFDEKWKRDRKRGTSAILAANYKKLQRLFFNKVHSFMHLYVQKCAVLTVHSFLN